MKNFIEFYYGFINIKLHENKKYYYFYYDNKQYVFTKTTRSPDELLIIYSMLKYNSKYNNIILNKDGKPYTLYKNNILYVLIGTKYIKDEIDCTDILNKNKIVDNRINILFRNDWVNLICKKIDYFEYQREHINNKYKILSETLDYYIGMSENAIAYISSAIKDCGNVSNYYVLSHKRIISNYKNDYYDPLSLVIDNYSRDISEYLKYLFINKKYTISILEGFFRKLNIGKLEYQLLYGRMLYPSFYFDRYELIVNNNKKETIINEIIERSQEYENYLRIIYKLISKKIKIPNIDWI